jgi:formylglycine-generating enzyme required for sulfatase activity
MDEWDIAIRGGEKYTYSGSEDLDSVAWTDSNSGGKTHEVAQLKPNGFGIYDMSGNVFEWVWSERDDNSRYYRGGSYFDAARAGKCTNKEINYASRQSKSTGFRITWNKPVA